MRSKVALITGAARGIGNRVASELAKSGMHVACLDQDSGLLHKQVRDLQSNGYTAFPYEIDVSDPDQVEQTIEKIERDVGPITYLANVAGVMHMGTVDALSNDDWTHTFSVNATGVFNLCRAVSKRMIPRREGAIVTVGSNAASTPRIGFSAYAASKAAATMFTKCLGLELAPHNIRCNVVSPGSTETEMLQSVLTGEDSVQQFIKGVPESYRLGIPLQKIAQPIEIANTVLFLLSDQASHITMQNISVDGGATLGV
ncbi:2,3-dihydro-2,3-dihydroxybenzoate dehydrogenase [Hazenella sp. IB182357]|uniref:2,3-dihydro-2,3-dihydroxybenzoate dehydrogenase n=1 Tax=Polycladospora coralii TaxID=2771432 RepID=A0A926N7N2_9BACL|nr:2,3-dihydro-2,3-dihydroxybenzoate dehydrogenase [Polycladospora coralii]MBD1371003.1 2,3-dihydro-2,3-dihydroxybenzoate dehydrogenase [Polycladospora coralii]MBS7529942.1 2,3-dihydro-2,3-dihydroxybenzoate dehydrogenase [Polycladospora coralii]